MARTCRLSVAPDRAIQAQRVPEGHGRCQSTATPSPEQATSSRERRGPCRAGGISGAGDRGAAYSIFRTNSL